MISRSVLRAFGFRRALKTRYCTEDAWYNPELEVYYYPKHHTDAQFANILLVNVIHSAMRKLLVDGVCVVVNKILGNEKK